MEEKQEQKVSKTIPLEFIKQVESYLNRKKNTLKDTKAVREDKLKAKKKERRTSNKNRKINQKRNRKNKFTR